MNPLEPSCVSLCKRLTFLVFYFYFIENIYNAFSELSLPRYTNILVGGVFYFFNIYPSRVKQVLLSEYVPVWHIVVNLFERDYFYYLLYQTRIGVEFFMDLGESFDLLYDGV